MANKRRPRLLPLEDRLVPSVSLVKDINRDLAGGQYTQAMVAVNDTVLFRPLTGTDDPVWASDGTPGGTGPVPGVQFDLDGRGVNFAGARYFTWSDPAHGDELWRTDGTAAGTRLVKDTLAGPGSGYPQLLAAAGDTLYFVANQNQLWRSDGTTAGTVPIRRIGTPLAGYDVDALLGIQNVMAAGDRAYLQVNGTRNDELWITDGTLAGTHPVADLVAAGGYHVVTLLGGSGGSFYFTAASEGTPTRLWVTDGTEAGTRMVRDDLTATERAAAVGGRLFFVASDGTSGTELWVTDGTAAGTTPVKDIHPAGFADPRDLVAHGSYLYFTADDGTTGRELWRTDGTEAGTVRLADLAPGPESPGIDFLTPTAGGLYFTARTPAAGEELWVTDGTPEGTVQVADLEPGPGSSFPTWLTAVGDRVFWAADTAADGSALWVAGPGAGPALLSPVPARTEVSTFGSGVTIDGVRYTVARDGDSGGEVWRTDGTAAGTWMLKDIVPGAGSSFPSSLTAVGGTLYFAATSPDAGTELWASDGTPDGTRMVRDIVPGPGGSSPIDLTAFQGKVYFAASTDEAGTELWVSDGTADGTRPVKDINPGPASAMSFAPRQFIELNGDLYFTAQDPGHGFQVWRTDGTEAGTTRVTDLPPSGWPAGWRPAVVGDRIVFSRGVGTGAAYWSTDGTPEGTVALGLAATFLQAPGDGTVVGGRLLLWAGGGTRPHGLWATDGTPEGTVLLRATNTKTPMVMAGGLAFFTTVLNETSGIGNEELWRTDGTPAGTARLRAFGEPIGMLAPLGDRLYFAGHDPRHGYGLWTSDGTAAGTRLVKDLVPASQREIGPASLFRVGGSLFLQVTTVSAAGTDESTLWHSDGTEAGTRPIAAGEFFGVDELDGVALFTHDDGRSGYEFWRYDPVRTGGDRYGREDGLRLDVPAAAGLLANDADGGGGPLTARLLAKPTNGWLTLRSDGSFSYQPFSKDFSGTDTFTYRAEGGGEQSAPVTVSIDVDLTNQAPTPADDTASGRAGAPVVVRVLANDTDPDQDTFTIASFTQGAGGRVARVGNALVYTPRAGAPPTDTFTYTVRDRRGETATATVTVHLGAAPPKVQAVRLFPGPGAGSVNLATLGSRSLPFGHLARLEVTFSADVSVSADDLRLVGAAGGAYALSGFAYDPARRTASWVIDGPATAAMSDRLLITIDGATGPTGVPVGTWAQTFGLLVGDVDGNGLVTAADVAGVRARFGSVDSARRLLADLDKNGVVDAADAALATANLGARRV